MLNPTLKLIAGSPGWYQDLWTKAELTKDKQQRLDLNSVTTSIVKNQARYLSVQKSTGIPWPLIASLHSREQSLKFDGCLHNGDPLNKITRRVPSGRGPFSCWEDSALDALDLKKLTLVKEWTLWECLAQAERFNGLGYLKYHRRVLSPYIWSFTSHYVRGKYSHDGLFNGRLVDRQAGVGAILMNMIKLGILTPDNLLAPPELKLS